MPFTRDEWNQFVGLLDRALRNSWVKQVENLVAIFTGLNLAFEEPIEDL